jgi:regulator of sirC expression with transglutaminase-like and TPR domain
MDYRLAWQSFYQEINRADEDIDLAKASLYYAQAEYPNLNIQKYLNILDTMAEEIQTKLPQNRYPLKVINTINQYLFDDLQFQGNDQDYYNPANSFLNEVIERRTGIPISLSVLYLEIAKRINFPMVGIGMPGHFLIRPEFEEAGIFIDVFNQGEILFQQDCAERLQQLYPHPIELEPRFLAAVSSRQILARMLTNLKYIYLNRKQFSKVLATIDGILMLFPDNPNELRDRGLLYYELDQWDKACLDLEYYLAMLPNAEDADMIRLLLAKIR